MNDDRIKLSVIIPVYNAEAGIRRCIESVLDQTLKNIEVICIDDGSEDHSKDILNELAQKDVRVKIFEQRNSGAGVARNLGMRNAVGQYIAFMDSDDYYPDEKATECLVKKAEEMGASICGGSMQFDWKGKLKKAKLEGVKYNFDKEGWIDYRDFQQDYYYQRFIYERKMLIDNNIFFPDYRRYQDTIFCVKAMLTAGRLYAIADNVYNYSTDKTGITWTEEKIKDKLTAMEEELLITKEAKLEVLHRRIVSRIEAALEDVLKNEKLRNNPDVMGHFVDLYNAIDSKIISERNNSIELLERYIDTKDKDVCGLYEPHNKCEISVTKRVKRGIQCCCDHGIVYTIWLAKEKFAKAIKRK